MRSEISLDARKYLLIGAFHILLVQVCFIYLFFGLFFMENFRWQVLGFLFPMCYARGLAVDFCP